MDDFFLLLLILFLFYFIKFLFIYLFIYVFIFYFPSFVAVDFVFIFHWPICCLCVCAFKLIFFPPSLFILCAVFISLWVELDLIFHWSEIKVSYFGVVYKFLSVGIELVVNKDLLFCIFNIYIFWLIYCDFSIFIYLFIDSFIVIFLKVCCACIFVCAIYLPSIYVCY